jgi:hypothetical protein
MSAASDLFTLVEQTRHLITATEYAVDVFTENNKEVPYELLLKELISNIEKAIEKATT